MGVMNKRNGFSLVGLLAGIAILAIVLMASAYLVVQTKTVEVRFDLQAELDRSHLISLQKTRSVKYLKKFLNLSDVAAENVGGAMNTELRNCLARNGTNCLTTNAFSRQYTEVQNAGSTSKCSGGSGCEVVSRIEYKVNCSSATSCESVEVQFESSFSGNNQASFKQRKNIVKLPGILFADKARIGFNCTSNQVMSGINFQTLQALCPNAAPRGCPNDAPIQGYGAASVECPQLVAQPCPNGMKTVGLYNGQAACR